jgi:hypothetical protein
VSSSDPLPPEDGGDKGKGDPDTGTTRPDPGVSLGGSYDQLLARANKLAETNCSKALEVYAKALEQKPNGVEALTGQGYCHIDAKQFASAFSKFRSALAISARYEPALWGVAEAYQQQGRREQAIEAYKRYLEVYPGTAKAQKQLDRLTGGTSTTGTSGTSTTGTSGGTTTVTGTSGAGTGDGSAQQPQPEPQPQPQKDPPPPEQPAPPPSSGSGS